MSTNQISKPEDFRRALERGNIERVELPSGLAVLLCRPPVFAALSMGRTGTQLQARITGVKVEDIRSEDIEAFTRWLNHTLARLFVEPRFSSAPQSDEIGLADILVEDLRFIFRWLRGEVFSQDSGARIEKRGGHEDANLRFPIPNPESSAEDLGRFSGRQGAASVPGGSGQTK